ncbi:MAG: single-stranded DNA-binding protein [Phycisphaerales bacterium]|nr:single-stranded DNA-binding protein [Phycisphaerales bacterium]
MAGNFNKVILMGNLTRDPEVKFAANNNAICKIGLAVNRRFTTASGEKREEVTFVDCDAFGKTGENIGKYFTKGKPIFIEGHLRLDQWEKEGQKFSKLKVVIDTFQFIDSGGSGGGGRSGSSADEEGGAVDAPPRVQTRSTRQPQAAAPEINEEDIPF